MKFLSDGCSSSCSGDHGGRERERETTTTAETIAVPVRDFSLFAGFSFLFYIEI